MGILRTDRVTGLGGANAIKGSVFFAHDGDTSAGESGALQISNENDALTFGTGDWTIELWFYANRVGVVQTLFDNRGTGAGTNTAVLIRLSDSNNIQFFTTNAFRITGSTTIIKNAWHHVALTRTGSTHTLYVNGSSDGTYSNSGMDYIGPVNSFAIIGSDDNRDGRYGLNGFVSNLRVAKELIYSAAFSVPTTALTPTSNTTLLCCQSSGNVNESFGDCILTAFASNTNSRGPEASRFTPNSPVGFSTTTDVGTQFGSTFGGVTTFDSQAYMVPPAGNTRERNRGRGLIMGGATGSPSTNTDIIKYFDVASQGITETFGNLTDPDGNGRRSLASLSSSTRACTGGGYSHGSSPGTVKNIIDFVTIATTGNATDFGDMQNTAYAYAPASNQTRGLFAGGYQPNNGTVVNTIDLITIATTGNASNFGDLTVVRRALAGLESTTRGVFAGGTYPAVHDEIDFVTFSTTGNATDFGDLTDERDNVRASSSSTRGVMGGGRTPSNTNIIDFITIASAGNATDFGDLLSAKFYYAATGNKTRAVWAGDNSLTNAMEFVTIATTGNAVDFGDQNGTPQQYNGCASDSHGGLS